MYAGKKKEGSKPKSGGRRKKAANQQRCDLSRGGKGVKGHGCPGRVVDSSNAKGYRGGVNGRKRE